MRLLATAFVLATGFGVAAVHAEAFDWPGHGTIRVAVPTGWGVRAQPTNEVGLYLIAQPQAAPVVSAQFSAPAAPAGEPFTFTVPQSRVIVKVSDPSLRPDDAAPARPSYFKLTRRDPQLILSGWLEPASSYKGLKEFWQSESRSPAYAGALAPTRVEMLKTGPWDVVAFDVLVPGGGASAHVRAERVQAGTWIDLHLSTTSARPPATLRAELLAVLRQVQVVEKQAR
jgi:hypothetical protein